MQKKFKKDRLYCPRCYSPLIKVNIDNEKKDLLDYIFTCSNETCHTKIQRCFWNSEGYLNHDINNKYCQDHFILGCYYAINSQIRKIIIERKYRNYNICHFKFLHIYIKAKSICNSSGTQIIGNRYKIVIMYKDQIGWIQYQNGLLMLFKNIKIFKYILKKYRENPSYIAIKYLKSFLEPNIHNDWWSYLCLMIINNKYPDLKKEIDNSFDIFKKRKHLKIPLNKK